MRESFDVQWFPCIPDTPSALGLSKSISISKETVVLRGWKSETWKFSFTTGVDKSGITNVKDLDSNVSSVSPSSERMEEL